MKGRPGGFEWTVRDKEVVITHHGVESAVLRGERAREFVREAEKGDEQLLMARIAAGSYKPRQERSGRKPPRRRQR